MMLHHPFRSKDLDNPFVLEDGSPAANWQLVYEKCLAHHSPHPVDALGVYQQELDDNSDMESVEQDNADDVKHEKLLGMRRPHHNGSQFELETNLGQRLQDKEYDWLAPKSYPVDVDQFSKHIGLVPRVASQNAPETLSQAGDISILNAGQCQVFDQIVDHYLHPQVTQLLMHLDGVAGSGKSTLIDMISSQMAYHAAQRRHPDPVL